MVDWMVVLRREACQELCVQQPLSFYKLMVPVIDSNVKKCRVLLSPLLYIRSVVRILLCGVSIKMGLVSVCRCSCNGSLSNGCSLLLLLFYAGVQTKISEENAVLCGVLVIVSLHVKKTMTQCGNYCMKSTVSCKNRNTVQRSDSASFGIVQPSPITFRFIIIIHHIATRRSVAASTALYVGRCL
jgi:hypothetical protein